MRVEDVFLALHNVALDNDLGVPYIVGGVPRDILLNRLDEFNDIDITTGRKDMDILAKKFAEEVSGHYTSRKGHSRVQVGGLFFDFSTNFTYKDDEIFDGLIPEDSELPLELIKETLSRDFTVNTLLMPMDLSETIDVSGRGIFDVKSGIVDCPVNCVASFNNSPNRMLRAYLYQAKYGFNLSSSVKKAIVENRDILEKINKRYASSMVNSIVRMDNAMLDVLIEDGVLRYLPLTKYITKELISSKKLLEIL